MTTITIFAIGAVVGGAVATLFWLLWIYRTVDL